MASTKNKKKTIKLKYSYTNGRLCSECKCVLWRLGSFIVAQLFFSSSFLCNSHCGTPILVCIFVVLLLSVHQLASSFERNWSLFFGEKQISFVLIISTRPYIWISVCFFSVLHPFQLVTSFNVETTTKTEFHFQEQHAQYLYSYTNSSDILKPSVEFLFCQNFLFVFWYLHRLWERIKIFVEQKYSAKKRWIERKRDVFSVFDEYGMIWCEKPLF